MNLNNISTMLDFLYQRTLIPCSIIDENNQLCFPEYSLLLQLNDELKELFIDDKYDIHIINTYEFFAGSFCFTIENKKYRLLIGPCIILGINVSNEIIEILKSRVSSETLESFKQLCQQIYFMINNKSINNNKIPIHYLKNPNYLNSINNSVENNLYNRRMAEATRDSYHFELRFLDYVKKGRKDKIDWFLSSVSKTYGVYLADDEVESIKLKSVSLITLLTRLVIANNVPLDSAFSLSDSLIQGLKNINNTKECLQYLKYTSYAFIDLINAYAKSSSTLINQCLSYIDTHLYQKITLQDLSKFTQHSPVYISSQFKKELDQTFSHYLLTQRIEESKNLLLFTDYTLQEITTLLNFASQSHFTERFKQITGQTPKNYRQTNFQYL